MRRGMLLAAIAALTLGACSGPQTPLRIGSKTVAVDVEFGRKPPTLEHPADVAPVDVEVRRAPGGGVVITPAERPAPARRPGPLALCPEASPFAFPRKDAGNVVEPPAPAGPYDFRAAGAIKRGTATIPYPAVIRRTVEDVMISADGSTSQYSTVERYANITVRTTIRAEPTQIGLASMQIADPVAGTMDFTPVTPVKIFPVPPRAVDPLGRPVTTWRGAGSDPVHGSTMTVDGTIKDRERIDACGVLVDSWLVTADVRLAGPLVNQQWTWRLNVATQYGGLIVAERVQSTGTIGLTDYARDLTATVNSDPGAR